jgi:hypothetical protein
MRKKRCHYPAQNDIKTKAYNDTIEDEEGHHFSEKNS